MKGKRRLSERLTAFLIAFAMTAGMVMEPVSVSALPEELVGAQSMAQASAEDSQQTPPETQEPPIDAGDSGDVIPPAPSVTKIVVNGQVLCGETAVEGARISIGESIVTTNTEGVFSCEVGANQNYEAVIEKEGFERKVVSLTAGEENINLVGIQIVLADIVLDKEGVSVAVDSSDRVNVINPVSYASYSWTISDETVATVTEGIVTGVKSGNTAGTVTMNTPYGAKQKEFTVGVDIAAPDMTFSVDPLSGVNIEKVVLTAQITFGTGTVKDRKSVV